MGTVRVRGHKEDRALILTSPDWLAAETNGKTGKSSEVAPVFPRRRGNPKGSRTPGGFLCFFLGRARKKKLRCKHLIIDSPTYFDLAVAFLKA